MDFSVCGIARGGTKCGSQGLAFLQDWDAKRRFERRFDESLIVEAEPLGRSEFPRRLGVAKLADLFAAQGGADLLKKQAAARICDGFESVLGRFVCLVACLVVWLLGSFSGRVQRAVKHKKGGHHWIPSGR